MIVLDDWQKEILNYDGNILLASGRQIGKSQIFSIKAAHSLLDNARTRGIVVSLTEDQAKLIIIMILDYIEKIGQTKAIATGINKPTQNKITLKNGSYVLARPVGTTGDALRGFTADWLFMDEVAHFSELILQAALPVLASTNGKIWMASTFNAKQGFFWNMFNRNPNNRFKIWHKSTEDVYMNRPISSEWTAERRKGALEFLAYEKASLSNAVYGQTYLGIPLDDLKRFFEDELIKKCCVLKRPEGRREEWNYYTGHDIARMGGDQFTAEVLGKHNGAIKQVESYGRKFLDTVDNENEIKKFAKIWDPNKIGIDSGSGTLGVSVYDHLSKIPELKYKLVAMNNRGIKIDRDGKMQRMNIEDYYDNLKGMMQRGEIELLDDDDLIESLRSIQLDIVEDTDKQGRVSKVKIWGSYSHHAEGLTRAAKLAQEAKDINFKISYI